mgnify:CR=1 FL=1
MRIDGGTSVDERQSIVDNFNTRGIGQVRVPVLCPANAVQLPMMQCTRGQDAALPPACVATHMLPPHSIVLSIFDCYFILVTLSLAQSEVSNCIVWLDVTLLV